MLNADIEKEIKQENKIILGLNLRKLICVLIALVFAVIFALIFNMNFYISIIPSMAVGTLCFAFGWINFDGLCMEEHLRKQLKN